MDCLSWQQIDDPLLNSWIAELDKDKNALKAAAERSVQAREAVSVVRTASVRRGTLHRYPR